MPDLPEVPNVDHQPVRPLRARRTALAAISVSTLLGLAALRLFLPFRRDLEQLGTVEAFALSGLELLTAGILLSLGLRQLIPGRLLPPFLLTSVGAVAACCGLLVGVRSAHKSPAAPPPGEELAVAALCVAVIAGLSALFIPFAWRFVEARATPRRGTVSLLLGLAAGLAANAVWRLFCPYSDATHQTFGHGGGVLLVVVLAVVCIAARDRSAIR